jgi:hypothetical protein
MRSLKLTAAAAVLVIATAGCGGSDGDSDSDSSGDSSGEAAGPSSTPTSEETPESSPRAASDPIDTCALIDATELSEATGADYGDGVDDGYGQCVWRVGGATSNNGEGQLVVAVQDATLDFIKSVFTGGVDSTVDGRDAYWNPDEGLQSMWVDLDGRCLVLSFDPVDADSQAVAQQVAEIAVGHL